MYTFRVLGTVDLRGADGRRIGSLLSQPKRLALLALLAIESPRRLQRDEVMARLWPEMSEERARNALRQALHYLRRSLGPGVIAGKGEEGLGIDPGKLTCDAADLLAAVADDRHGDAVDLYEGELLPGFHLDGGPHGFEEWLDETRRRVQRLAAESARALAAAEEAAGNAVGAGVAARKAWELGDWGEPALQELLGVLVRTGDASGARTAYEEFADRLSREYGAEPSEATRSILDEVSPEPRPAPRLEENQESTDGSLPSRLTSSAAVPSIELSTASAAPARPRTRVWWPAIAAILVAGLVGVWTLLPRASDGTLEAAVFAGNGPPTLYLEPVRDLRPAGDFPTMAEAVTTELAGRLSETEGYVVVALAGGKEPAAGHGVRLRPTLRDVGDQLQFSVLLLDPASDAVLDRLTIGMPIKPNATPDLLAGHMAPKIRRGAGDVLSLRGLAKRGIRADALKAVREAALELEGANELRMRGALDPAALAYASTDSLLQKAADIEGSWPEPPVRRAEIALKSMWLYLVPPNDRPDLAQQTVVRGLSHAESAIAIAPEHARAREVRGLLLYWAAQTTSDPDRRAALTEEAEGELEEAVRRDPGLPRAWSLLSALAERRGDFATAYHRARRAYVADYDLRVPTDIMIRLFTNALEVGDRKGAAEWCAEIRRRQADGWLGPYCDLTHLAWVGPWTVEASETLLEEGLVLSAHSRAGHAPAHLKLLHAVVLAKAGEAAAAREVLATVDALGPRSLDILDLQAWVRTALGEGGQARQLLAAAAELNPDVAPRVLRSRRYDGLSSYALVRNDD